MSKVLRVGTIYWFSSLGNYPTEMDFEILSSRLLRSSLHSIIWVLVKVLHAAILVKPMKFVRFASFRSSQTAWWLLLVRNGMALRTSSYPTRCTHLTHQRYPCAFLSIGGRSSIMARAVLNSMNSTM